MEVLAYGLFPDRAAADAAIARLERRDIQEVLTIHEHEGEVQEQDVQGQGTRSRLYALLGGGFAALLGGVLAAVLFGDRFAVGPIGVGFVAAVAAGALGTLASIAGSALPRRELGRLERELAEGRTLVTINVESKRVGEQLQNDLERCGALRTGVLYGPGLGSSRIGRRRRARVPQGSNRSSSGLASAGGPSAGNPLGASSASSKGSSSSSSS